MNRKTVRNEWQQCHRQRWTIKMTSMTDRYALLHTHTQPTHITPAVRRERSMKGMNLGLSHCFAVQKEETKRTFCFWKIENGCFVASSMPHAICSDCHLFSTSVNVASYELYIAFKRQPGGRGLAVRFKSQPTRQSGIYFFLLRCMVRPRAHCVMKWIRRLTGGCDHHGGGWRKRRTAGGQMSLERGSSARNNEVPKWKMLKKRFYCQF